MFSRLPNEMSTTSVCSDGSILDLHPPKKFKSVCANCHFAKNPQVIIYEGYSIQHRLLCLQDGQTVMPTGYCNLYKNEGLYQ